MLFSTRLTVCFVAPALMFVAAAGSGVWGLMRTQAEFAQYMAVDQKISDGLSEMYAQALQSGHALRDLVLDTKNMQAMDSVTAAQAAFDVAFQATEKVAAGRPFATSLAAIAALRQVRDVEVANVIKLVNEDSPQASSALSSGEMPAWRKLRVALLAQRETARKDALEAHAQAQQRGDQAIVLAEILALLAMFVALVMGWFMHRSSQRALGGEPADAVQVMQTAAQGDFSPPSKLLGRVPGSLLSAFGDMSGSIRSMIVKIHDEAGTLKDDAARLSDSVQQVTTAAGYQADATASMAAAIEQLTVSVSHISDAARDSEQLSAGMAGLCRSGEEQVNGANQGMQRIASAVGEASGKISGLEARVEKINVIAASIKDIASQTNLLALNAAIEAARAGEQGRGFSVVADEVRRLAERTASATIEIEQMVKVVQAEAKESTASMDRVGPIVDEGSGLTRLVAEALRDIRNRADLTLERVREVAYATQEQSSASNAIAEQVESIAQMVEETNASMEENARSASDMHDMSVRLDRLVSTFKV
jgi:methyl-accepting chemotaxis protein